MYMTLKDAPNESLLVFGWKLESLFTTKKQSLKIRLSASGFGISLFAVRRGHGIFARNSVCAEFDFALHARYIRSFHENAAHCHLPM
jgi:hypothetical protein